MGRSLVEEQPSSPRVSATPGRRGKTRDIPGEDGGGGSGGEPDGSGTGDQADLDYAPPTGSEAVCFSRTQVAPFCLAAKLIRIGKAMHTDTAVMTVLRAAAGEIRRLRAQ